MPLVLQTDRAAHTLVVACLLGARRRCGVLKWTRLQLLPLLAMLCCGCDQLAQNRTTPKAATTTPAEFGLSHTSSLSSKFSGTSPNVRPSILI